MVHHEAAVVRLSLVVLACAGLWGGHGLDGRIEAGGQGQGWWSLRDGLTTCQGQTHQETSDLLANTADEA
ncbi:MAG: hypothetical protein R3F44_12165 [Candidatus Competibacteraceae bacterium]